MEKTEQEREFGLQRLDELMVHWELTNHDLVVAGGDEEQLTHKQVQRARKGRKLTLGMTQKIARVLNAAILQRLSAEQIELFHPYTPRDLFSYVKGFEAEKWRDSDEALAVKR